MFVHDCINIHVWTAEKTSFDVRTTLQSSPFAPIMSKLTSYESAKLIKNNMKNPHRVYIAAVCRRFVPHTIYYYTGDGRKAP